MENKKNQITKIKGISHQIIIAVSCFSIICSCNSDKTVFNEYQSIPDQKWSAEDTLQYNLQIDKPEDLYNVYFMIRTTTDYQYSNFFFFMEINKPKQPAQVDTFQMILARPDGRWVGKNSGTLVETKFQIAKKIKFPEKGKYTFKLVHGMQDKTLTEISDIGLMLSKTSGKAKE